MNHSDSPVTSGYPVYGKHSEMVIIPDLDCQAWEPGSTNMSEPATVLNIFWKSAAHLSKSAPGILGYFTIIFICWMAGQFLHPPYHQTAPVRHGTVALVVIRMFSGSAMRRLPGSFKSTVLGLETWGRTALRGPQSIQASPPRSSHGNVWQRMATNGNVW